MNTSTQLDKQSHTILEVVNNSLCCGCGTCIGVCPADALNISDDAYTPQLDANKCKECDLCYEVCPGRGYPVTQWAKDNCEPDTEFHPLRGPVRSYLIGHSTDDIIRANSASGGIATGVLLYLLESESVDQVLVVIKNGERCLAKFTNNPEEVRQALQSKYGPVPAVELFRELKDNPKPTAIVGTPCQLAGWAACIKKYPYLNKYIKLKVGLFCGQVQSYDALKAIAATIGCDYPDHAEFIGWRCGPYPGSAQFRTDKGSILEKPLYPWLDVAVPHFNLQRCILCPDGGNWLADMTLGDIYAGGDDETVIVCRTKIAENTLKAAKNEKYINYRSLDSNEIKNCVISGITNSKLLPGLYRINLRMKKRLPFPQFDYGLDLLTHWPIFRKMICKVHYKLWNFVRHERIHNFLFLYPRLMEKVGHFLYRFPSTIPGWKLLRFLKKIKS